MFFPSLLANRSVIKLPHLSFTAFVVLRLSLLRVFVISYTSFILPLRAASSASMARWSTHFLLSCLMLFFTSLSFHLYSFSQRVINEWNKLPNGCVNASSVNMFKNRVDRYLIRAGYT